MSNSLMLAGARAKIERAVHHLADLQVAVQGFREAHPNLIVRDTDSEGAEKVFRTDLPEIPIEWSMMLGDCVHNLRTAFDHVICAAVRLNGKTPTDKTTFPISNCPVREYEPFARSRVEGTSQAVLDLVIRSQPYLGGREPFQIIHSLDVTDKHNAIIPVWARFSDVQVFRIVAGRFTHIMTGNNVAVHPGQNPEIGRMTDSSGGDHYFQFAFDIAFAKRGIAGGKPVIPTLLELAQLTQETVDIFDRNIFS